VDARRKETTVQDAKGLRPATSTIVSLAVGIQFAAAVGALVFAYAGRTFLRGAPSGPAFVVIPLLMALLLVMVAVGTLRRARWARLLGAALHVHLLWAAALAIVTLLAAGLSRPGASVAGVILSAVVPALFWLGVPSLLLAFYLGPRAEAALRGGLPVMALTPATAVLAFHLAVGAVLLIMEAFAPTRTAALPLALPVVFFAGYASAAWFALSGGPNAPFLAGAAIAVHWIARVVFRLASGTLGAFTGSDRFSSALLATFLAADLVVLIWATRARQTSQEGAPQ
jgi:hypothetical protein